MSTGRRWQKVTVSQGMRCARREPRILEQTLAAVCQQRNTRRSGEGESRLFSLIACQSAAEFLWDIRENARRSRECAAGDLKGGLLLFEGKMT